MRKFIASILAASILAGCASSTTPPAPLLSSTGVAKAQAVWSAVESAIGLYLVASKASEETVAKVAPLEAIVTNELSSAAALQKPLSLAAVQTDINTVIAALPAGTLPANATEYVLLEQQLESLTAAMLAA